MDGDGSQVLPAPSDRDDSIEDGVLDALDGLLQALELEPLGGDRFRAGNEPNRFDRLFGGQTLAQGLYAAAQTVEGKEPHSLHAYFVEVGSPERPLELTVDRLRDGRSMSSRRVTVTQDDRTLLVLMASFDATPPEPGVADPPPAVPPPAALPSLHDLVHGLAPDRRPGAEMWLRQPPPVQMRMAEPPSFLDGHSAEGPRTHWVRLPRDVGDNPRLHTALLTYASDYFLLDVVLRELKRDHEGLALNAFSIDHAMWFHRPIQFDQWHLYVQEGITITGHRGLVRGSMFDADGQLVATAMQEVLVRRPLEATDG